ncbi:class I adenylate-forming enzyme family protein [Donghicola mangrovi]|uniref:Acyl--CoA ligase n=1 Tax=Donghicola mangrovi TaxID=2729614 RepID=A0A850Q8Y7_9RHOB|nr:class I adenylate-forming enzyme family protein [Donghicola mangrovi]NVO22955.1 acyl--CoA ligase [Donghicola mangrovi]
MLSITEPTSFAACPQSFNLAAYVLAGSGAPDDKIALAVLALSGAERWSYGKLRAAALGTGTGLLAAGLKPGDRVMLRLGNTVDFPLAFLGAIAAGLVPVPTSSQLTAPEAGKLAQIVQPAAILQAPEVAAPTGDWRAIPLTDLRAMRDCAPVAPAMGDADRLAYIIFTSGTSGTPRAVCHAHRVVWARRMMWQGWYDLTANDRLLHAGAFNWSFTLGTGMMDPWACGATALIPADGTDPKALPLLLKRHDATLLAAAPGVYRKFLKDHPSLSLPKLRHGLCAGEKLPEALRTAWFGATGTGLYEAYGQTEISTFISGSPARPSAAGTLGAPQDGRLVAIVDDNGQPVSRGTAGTIAIDHRDPGLMLGYLDAPEATAEKRRGPWFLTGDQGIMGEDGFITYQGRDDDLMNAGGFRVSPLEVEAALAHFEGLHEIAVTDVEIRPDVRVIAAFYTAETELDQSALTAYAEAQLARYKQPRVWVRLAELPRNPNGKLRRKDLKLS